jgi:hypothetical protein
MLAPDESRVRLPVPEDMLFGVLFDHLIARACCGAVFGGLKRQPRHLH